MDEAAKRGIWDAEERFRLLVASVEDYAIFMLDPEGRVQTWNPGARRLKGYSADEIIGRHFSVFYPEEVAATGLCDRALAQAAETGRFAGEGWRRRKDGSPFWASVVISAVRGLDGSLLGFAKVTRDMTERRATEEERLQIVREREAIRLRDEFLSIASHELNTPLTALQLQLQRLRHLVQGLNGPVLDSLDRAVASAERLGELIEGLFELASVAGGLYDLRVERFDLTALVHEVMERIAPLARRSHCELLLEVPGPALGTWDRPRLRQVLINLLSNALKYGASHPVSVTLALEAERVVLEVSDQGPGIDLTLMPRIFERFERDPSLAHHGGLGLGLYVVRQLVEAHGGEVRARNLPGRGACFTVVLPLAASGGAATKEPTGRGA